jgi:hypothetical protein
MAFTSNMQEMCFLCENRKSGMEIDTILCVAVGTASCQHGLEEW